MSIDGKNPWDNLDVSHSQAKERRGHLLELIDSIDGALRPGIVFDDWMRGLFSKKAFSNADRQLYYTALLTWMRLRGWIQPVLQRSPQRAIAVLCLGPVTAFYDRPMLEELGWATPRPLADLLSVDGWD